MSLTDPDIPGTPPAFDESLPVIAVMFAAVALGWFPAVFLGDAVADAIGGGSELALLVTVVTYILLVLSPKLLRRVL